MNLRAIWAAPRLLSVATPQAALTHTQTLRPVRIVAEGLGLLTVEGGPRVLVLGRYGGILFTRAERDAITVRIAGPFGSAQRHVDLGPLISPSPRRLSSRPQGRDAEWLLADLDVIAPATLPVTARVRPAPSSSTTSPRALPGGPRPAVAMPDRVSLLPRVSFLTPEDV